MLVYSHRDYPAEPRSMLRQLEHDARATGSVTRPPHDALADLLIRFGELETAIVDAVCPDRDDEAAVALACRRAALAIGDAVVASWRADSDAVGPALAAFVQALDAIDRESVPAHGRRKLPEGYAFYALYPEMYIEAARQLWTEARPSKVFCLGIRSIGASLSAVTAAALRAHGVTVQSITVRPRGEPSNRVLYLSTRLEGTLASSDDLTFAIVDEGPGLSGSTFAAVADGLQRLGVPAERIVFLPGHRPDVDRLTSPAARGAWRTIRTYVGSFDDLGIIPRLAGGDAVADLSGGAWRAHLLPKNDDCPAAHPQHERRKYCIGDGQRSMVRFAGLGHYGTAVHERARELSSAGFTPQVQGLSDGFLRLTFVPGRPLAMSDVSVPVLDRMAEYLAYLRTHASRIMEAPRRSLLELLTCNVAEGLGAGWSRRLEAALPRLLAFDDVDPVAVDGRMLPHEWIDTGATLMKTDAFDHHQDDFYPGSTDIAWDLAGASVEFGLSSGAERYFVDRYAKESGDRGVARRLPFFRLAYLAYRLGYSALAAQTLEGSADGARFEALAERYRAHLQRAIDVTPSGP